VCWAQHELLPIAIEAPADRKTRDEWMDGLWQAIEDDGVDYLSMVQERWVSCAVQAKSPLAGRTNFSVYSGLLGPIHGQELRTRNQRLPLQPGGSGPTSGTA